MMTNLYRDKCDVCANQLNYVQLDETHYSVTCRLLLFNIQRIRCNMIYFLYLDIMQPVLLTTENSAINKNSSSANKCY